MKFLIISLALFATALAALPSSEYLPPLEDTLSTNNVDLQVLSDGGALAEDGYRYKTVKRLRLRHRRDVSELPTPQYLPPTEAQPVVDLPVIDSSASAVAESAVLADDGYRYKTVKRFRLRHRRDVNELPANQYLPPVEEAPVASAPVPVEAPAAVLADDGYRYKTVKRFRLRHRRDVNEVPASEYLPPVEEAPVASAPVPVEAPAAVLADDGYRYKTVKRFRLRHRRDVNEVPASEYLPPVEEAPVASAPAAVEAPAAVLADDGYRYKTVKRFRLRHRRDVNEVPASEYLPPVEEAPAASAPAPVEIVAAPEESAALADDGYRYKTVKRYRLRHRRDVNEIPATQYLPPVQEAPAASAPAPVAVEVAVAPEESAALADDGYRYKTVKRYRLRHRRDVSEIPTNEYLPPKEEAPSASAPAPVETEAVDAPVAPEVEAPAASEESAVLADDGYHYKTLRRVVYRHRN